MRATRIFGPTLCALAVTFVCSIAYADWNPGDPYKMQYPQLPDQTPTGLDVLDTVQLPSIGQQWKILADDFLCTESGPISDVHVWGSWLGERLPQGNNPGFVTFKLSIHSDVPGSPNGVPSTPGQELWSQTFTPTSFTVRPYGSGQEGFYDPNIKQVIGTDQTIWQYNFADISNPFVQQKGTIYWLDVQAQSLDPTATFGWKTTNPQDPRTPHFMDDAVYADTAGFDGPLLPGQTWAPLVYPAGHPYGGLSMDLAFVITPEPASLGVLALGGLLLRRRM